MQLDRTKQLAMLQALAAAYPRYTCDLGVDPVTEEALSNLWYLKEQGLVEGAIDMSLCHSFIFQGAKITGSMPFPVEIDFSTNMTVAPVVAGDGRHQGVLR